MHYIMAQINKFIDKEKGLGTQIEQNNFKAVVEQFIIYINTV